ncbi:MAG TPA: OFA family MFS transporter [Gemmatimonadales bacterium]|nr:OFA family MFS transporter [Gemmatimonadales bacterium]
MAGLLSRSRIVAQPGFNRWLVPPAALAIHLSIGQAYAFSVFKLPLTKVLGITQSAPGDWSQPELAWIFTIAIVFLGLSAAVFGRWLEHAGPRKSGVVAAICWSFGFFISSVGVRVHNIWLLYLGYGVLGGCGLGLGYITPVSTLIKWFPDRRGMATGLAIMGFGGGALIASPLSQALLDHYKSATSVGVAETFVTLGTIYLVAMLSGAFLFRVPAPDWKPAGWAPPLESNARLITRNHVHVDKAIRTQAFYLLWAVLFLNVTAGIGILEQASPMIQEMFKGAVKPSAAAGFVGLLSLFNMAGRFGWSSLSDRIGRKATYFVFFTLGPILYITLPYSGHIGSVALFVACAVLILTMYGGGFATIPAYLSDLFGTQYVGAIHGRLLTAWSAAGVAGPVLVNYIRQYRIEHGVPPADSYDVTMYLMAGLLVLGFLANLAVRPVPARYFMTEDELARERQLVPAGSAGR